MPGFLPLVVALCAAGIGQSDTQQGDSYGTLSSFDPAWAHFVAGTLNAAPVARARTGARTLGSAPCSSGSYDYASYSFGEDGFDSSSSFSYSYSVEPLIDCGDVDNINDSAGDPVVVGLSVGLAGLSCDEYGSEEEAVLNAALTEHIAGAEVDSFSRHSCTDLSRRLGTVYRSTSPVVREARSLLDASDAVSVSTEMSVDSSVQDDDVLASVTASLLVAASSGALTSSLMSFAAAAGITLSLTVTNIDVATGETDDDVECDVFELEMFDAFGDGWNGQVPIVGSLLSSVFCLHVHEMLTPPVCVCVTRRRYSQSRMPPPARLFSLAQSPAVHTLSLTFA